MADARPTFLLPQRYTQRLQKQFSRPMTGHTPQKLPFFNAISCIIAVRSADFAYTRSIILTRTGPFVNNFFAIFTKISGNFQAIRRLIFLCIFRSLQGDGLDAPLPPIPIPEPVGEGLDPPADVSLFLLRITRASSRSPTADPHACTRRGGSRPSR